MLSLTLRLENVIHCEYFQQNDLSIKIGHLLRTTQNKHGQNTNFTAAHTVMFSSGES